MKIEAEKMGERVATEELVRELVRNDARRGEFMIMSDDADEERFVQVACDYDDVGGKSDGERIARQISCDCAEVFRIAECGCCNAFR